MKVLIICNPEEGNATELCLFLKSEAERMNRRVVMLNAEDDSKAPLGFDAVVVAAALHGDGYGNIISNYITRYHEELSHVPAFFLSVYNCFDENNLVIPEQAGEITKEYLQRENFVPQKVLQIPVGTKLQHNSYTTFTDWPRLKMALQQFVIKNDLMMAG
jgi:menaquinone-dependent protoporphyrinogen IX oxidase